MLASIFEYVVFLLLIFGFGYFLAEPPQLGKRRIAFVLFFTLTSGLVSAGVREGITDYDRHAIIGMSSYIGFLLGFVFSQRKHNQTKEWSNILLGVLSVLLAVFMVLYFIEL